MGKARFNVAPELLGTCLGMPKGAVIYRVTQGEAQDRFTVYVTAPDLPTVPKGQPPPLVVPQLHGSLDIVLDDWGIERTA